jgi:hypothetical protein
MIRKPGEKLTEHGITAERLGDGNLRCLSWSMACASIE